MCSTPRHPWRLVQPVTLTRQRKLRIKPHFETFRAGRALTSLREHPVMEPNELSNKRIVLITGAKGGLGSCITQAFLGTGATVVGASRSVAAADFAEANFVPLSADFTKSTSANEAIQSVAT